MAFDEDMTEFFDVEDFAEAVTVAGNPVVGIFDVPYIESGQSEDTAATFIAPTADMFAAGAGDGITLVRTDTGISYRIRGEGQADATGNVTTWELERI